MNKQKIEMGNKFGRLTISGNPYSKLSKNGNRKRNYVLAMCECGVEREYDVDHLKTGHTQSCGCLRMEDLIKRATTHGLCRASGEEPLYRIWRHIKERCYNKNDSHFKHYGGRGITMWSGWINNPEVFFKWAMANGYATGLTIDRINNDGNYEPSNCHWVTQKENSRNKRTTKSSLEIANKIRNEFSMGNVKKATLAKKYNLNAGTVWQIIDNRQWV